MATTQSAAAAADTSLPWYRQVNATQWRAFWATFLGWVLDGFDFTILTFILIDIQKSFTVDSALAGALGTVTLMMRFVGGALAGTAADRWGRRLPLMLSILWFSLFAALSGFSTSYAMLFAFRALFGIGMGGEWAAGMPLVIEHWPAHLRGRASGLLQGGYSWGFILSATAYTVIYPYLTQYGELAWRAMFWIGVLPALLVLWIRRNVEESPVWLSARNILAKRRRRTRCRW
jgi:SHS family lactate transporter-like MFS transporter